MILLWKGDQVQRLPGAGLVARKFNFIEFFNCEFHGDSGGVVRYDQNTHEIVKE